MNVNRGAQRRIIQVPARAFESAEAMLQFYEELEFSTGTMVEPSRQTIDHGRVETLKRRQKFSTLSALLHDEGYDTLIEIPNEALLSPRRIYRASFGFMQAMRPSVCVSTADMIYKLLQDWRDEGYPDLEGRPDFDGKVSGWTVRLVQR